MLTTPISEDVDLFVSLTLRLSLDCLHDMITVISFVVILWNLSEVIVLSILNYDIIVHGYMVWAALLYAIIGTYFTVRFGKPLIQLDYDKQKYEAEANDFAEECLLSIYGNSVLNLTRVCKI